MCRPGPSQPCGSERHRINGPDDDAEARQAYLVYMDSPAAPTFPATDVCVLSDGLYLILSALPRSRLYHGIKRQLGPDPALLVAPLADAPKFRGMAPGALAFTRTVWPPG